MDSYTIGQVAERTGVSASTLRYYDQCGILTPAQRTAAGYRLYDDRSLARLQLIVQAKQLGCSLDEIADLAELWATNDCAPVQQRLRDLVDNHIARAQLRREELTAFATQLESAADRLGGMPDAGPCHAECACLVAADEAPLTRSAPNDTAVSCTLAGAEIDDRVDNWRSLLTWVTDREHTGVGLRLSLDPAAPIDEFVALATAEQRCCRFFAFTLTIDDRGVALEVSAPDAAGHIVTALFGDTTASATTTSAPPLAAPG